MAWITRKFIICDPDKCLGCQICEFACSAAKEKSCNPSFSRIHVVDSELAGSMALACVLCEKAPCVAVCPTRALFRGDNGVIRVEENKCDGCAWCFEACKFGAITMHPTKKVVGICDLCDGEPKCVKLCPFEDALTFGTLDEVAHKLRRQTVIALLQESGAKS